MSTFLETVNTQRWDDHRYYHQSRINQSLHLISAISFLVAYVLLFIDPATAALVAWGISMTTGSRATSSSSRAATTMSTT